jgi:hypothetical protein
MVSFRQEQQQQARSREGGKAVRQTEEDGRRRRERRRKTNHAVIGQTIKSLNVRVVKRKTHVVNLRKKRGRQRRMRERKGKQSRETVPPYFSGSESNEEGPQTEDGLELRRWKGRRTECQEKTQVVKPTRD